MIDLDFTITGYPGSGRRIEEVEDLSQVSRPDLIQGAFMGDAIFKIDSVDLGTNFGWVTLLDWCIRLSVSLEDLAVKKSRSFTFSESDDFVSFERHGEEVLITNSYSSASAITNYDDLCSAVRAFVDERLKWIEREFPAAMRNREMPEVFSRLNRPFPPLPHA
ncbi:hypothetical protein [Streptomyces sp. RFCAC02]|uniref:hypothetical protein n=1 Tax=Streptomyces sp. RFCAC02 TaxID=2499143 RepID=UPI0010221AFB|nr:hypothetical protein [Streptomyces sp. RFCAC02]